MTSNPSPPTNGPPASREKLAVGQMPKLVKEAFIAAEDRRFYQHNGVDVVGISRAVVTNLQSGSVKQGASTITQQLARVVFLNQDQTLIRKVKEAALALKLTPEQWVEKLPVQIDENEVMGRDSILMR